MGEGPLRFGALMPLFCAALFLYNDRHHCQSTTALFLDKFVVSQGSSEVSRGEKMALRGTDPESYITE